jgi:hypothetical protein
MRTVLIAASFLAFGIAPALASTDGWGTPNLSEPFATHASNINAADTRSDIAPQLPQPGVGPDAGPAGYLRAAEHALYRGQTGMAQNALEMAETRLLDRSVIRGQGSIPDNSHAIQSIDVALNDLARHDIAGAEQATRNAMPRIWQGTDQGNWNPAAASSGA